MFHSWNQTFRIIGCLGHSASCWEQHEGRSSDHIMYIQSSDVHVLWSSIHLFHLLALLSVIRDLATAALQWVSDLWRSRWTFFVETGSSGWVLSSAVTFAAAVLWCLDTTLFNVWRSLSLNYGCRPQFFLFPWSVYVVITLGTAALDTPNEVALWIQMMQLNAHWQSVSFENLTYLPFCSTFIQTATKHYL
jgi:hypothetical protein